MSLATAASYSRWEASWAWTERWVPHVLMAVSVIASIAAPEQTRGDRLATLGLACLAEAWLSAGSTFAPAERHQHAGYALGYVAGLLALSAAMMARDPIFFVFAVTGFLHSATLRPRPLVFVGTGATSFLILAMTWEGGFPQPTVGGNAGFLAVFLLQTVLIGLGTVGGEALHDITEQRRHVVDELRATLAENEGLQAQLVSQAREAGVVDERQRLAREMHDTLAQGLAGIITQLEAADQGKRDPATLQRHLDTASRLARQSLDEARRSVHALGPGSLERGRLADAITELTEDWSERTGVATRLAIDEVGPHLPPSVEIGLLRIVQEALANVAKHAGATRVGVSLASLDDCVVLDVRDDGRGFDVAGAATDRAGFGLTSMRQRAAELGGSLTIESQHLSGTAISAAVPLPVRATATETADA